jgi:hypothetical protein
VTLGPSRLTATLLLGGDDRECEGAMRRQAERGDEQTDARGRTLARLAVLAALAAAALCSSAPPAGAAVTIGQLAPGIAPMSSCPGTTATDFLQPTVTSGNPYFVREAGTLVSWSTNAAVGLNQSYVMKAYRKVADPATYRVVGHDGPRRLSGGEVNTFAASIAVQPGDVIGFNESGANNACTFAATGDSVLRKAGKLGDGEQDAFMSVPDLRLNITAQLVPTSAFTISRVTKFKSSGTAAITVNLPNPGQIVVSGKGVSASKAGRAGAAKVVTVAGEADVKIKATGKRRATLGRKGRVTVKPRLTFTPNSGDPFTLPTKVRLRKKLS